jgi:DNA-binding NarL/FixJ family response regulator
MTLAAENGPKLRMLLAIHTRELKTAFFLALSDRPSVQIVATATNTAELLTYSRTFQPDVIALEWEMPGRPVADVMPTLAEACASTEILIVSRPSSRQQIRDLAPRATVVDEPEELVSTLEALMQREFAHSGQSWTKEVEINHDK